MAFYKSFFPRNCLMKLKRSPSQLQNIFLIFALKCRWDFNFGRPFWYGQVEIGKLKFCRHFRAKLKQFLWFGDLKASSLSNSSEKLIYNTPSSGYTYTYLCQIRLLLVILHHLIRQLWGQSWSWPRNWPRQLCKFTEAAWECCKKVVFLLKNSLFQVTC